jgi:hypothetical protein
MTWLSLADFGDVSHCDWFPPTMEEDLRPADGDAFLHPMLDRRRYVSSMLHNRGALAPGELDSCTGAIPPRGIREAHLAGGPLWRGRAGTAQALPLVPTGRLIIATPQEVRADYEVVPDALLCRE